MKCGNVEYINEFCVVQLAENEEKVVDFDVGYMSNRGANLRELQLRL